MGTQSYQNYVTLLKFNFFLFGKTHCKCSLNGGAMGGVMQNTLHIALKFSFAQRLARLLGQRGRS